MGEEIFDKLIKRIKEYHNFGNLELIERAYKLANEAHKDQNRMSGEAYIIHPIETAYIIADLELDLETITAALLHDVIEDTIYTKEQIAEMFTDEIAELVNGVTKLTKMQYEKYEENSSEYIQAENYRKMFLAMAKDIRVILIKLADRLHNMRTLNYMTEEKQKLKSQETLDIYAPLAHRLGISKIKVELEDLALRYLHPKEYYSIGEKIKRKKVERIKYVEDMMAELKGKLDEVGIKSEIQGRAKHFFSIYRKMQKKHKSIDSIYDLFAVRVLVDSVKDCYGVLGVVHEMYTPMPGRFKDYIAMPKPNMYQSLHSTLIGADGQPFEIQIRTYEMHKTSEYGIAAHWKYKQSGGSAQINQEQALEEKLKWLRQVLDWQNDLSDNGEYIKTLKSDLNLYDDQVYVFTPKGKVINFPQDSTPIDFAYNIHSAVGNKMVGAKINDRIVTFDYKMQNGDRVEILTSQNAKGPSRDWLKIVKTNQAKTKINQWFKTRYKEENIEKGKRLLEEASKRKGMELCKLLKPEWMDIVLKKYGLQKWDVVYALIGHGDIKESKIIHRLYEEYEKTLRKEFTVEDLLNNNKKIINKVIKHSKSKSEVLIKGVDNVAINFAKCCSPLPGDEIIGFITKGRGISIHRTDCKNIINMTSDEKNKMIEAEWTVKEEESNFVYVTEFKVIGDDRSGLVLDISMVINDMKVHLKGISAKVEEGGSVQIGITVELKGKTQLENLINKIKAIKGIREVVRISG